MKSGCPPTDRNARTGLLTPPGMTRCAAAKSLLDAVVFIKSAPPYHGIVKPVKTMSTVLRWIEGPHTEQGGAGRHVPAPVVIRSSWEGCQRPARLSGAVWPGEGREYHSCMKKL